MKFIPIAIILLLITPINYNIHIEGNSVYKNACRYNIQGYIYVHIEGSPYERGYQHGYLLYAEIIDMLYRWSNIIHNCPIIIKYLPTDVNSSQYEKLSQTWWNSCRTKAMKIFWPYYPEEYKEEIKGIADGVKARGEKFYGNDITYEDILTLNEMYELMTILTNPIKRVHIARDIFHSMATIFPILQGKENEFYFDFSPSQHCNGFAAVGNATKDGNIVISDAVWCGGWWYTYYIAQRWNVILDISPDKGHRLVIATSPGYIWSDEDYWQNDVGLAMIETTFIQGYYKLKGMPLAIRTRMAIQYGNSIDDVIAYLLKDNTGIMNAQWLIADERAKEIALLEFGLYNYAVERTKNGFLWSANNPFNFRVRREILGYESLKAPLFRLAHLLLNANGYQYYTFFYTPSDRDIKYEELGKKYYGRIDCNVVKKILSTPPISDFTTCIEITDGNLIKQNALWGFYGNPNYVWNTSSLAKLKGVRDVPPDGWVKIYSTPDNFKPNYEKGNKNKGTNAQPLWSYEFNSNESNNNYDYAKLAVSQGNLYAAVKNILYEFNENGSMLWQKDFDGIINEIYGGKEIYVLTDNASYAINEGKIEWQGHGGNSIFVGKNIYIASKDGIYCNDEKIINVSANNVAYSNGNLYFSHNNSIYCYNGNIKWEFKANLPITGISIKDKFIYASSWDGNLYCLDEDGKLKWTYTAGWGVEKAVIKNDIYFASLDGNLYCLDEDGKLKWTYSSNASIHGGIAVYGDYIFFGSDDGRFYAVNRSNGNAAWSFAPSYEMDGLYNYITTPILSNAVAFNKKVFFSADGKIFCMDAQTFEKVIAKQKDKTNVAITGIIAIIISLAIISFVSIKKIKKIKE